MWNLIGEVGRQQDKIKNKNRKRKVLLWSKKMGEQHEYERERRRINT